MTEPEGVWRIILNWIIPTSLGITIVKVATKMLKNDVTIMGALLTSIISMLMGVIAGNIIYLVTDELWQTLVATAFFTVIGEHLANWFVYEFKIDKAMTEISGLIINKIKKFFK